MSYLHNPHLPQNSFYWQGDGVKEWGRVGLLLMHGLTATPVEVRRLAEKLHPLGYTIAAPLLPGHGTTPTDLNQVKWSDWVWEAEQSYHHLLTTCDHVFVGGESTGAVVALYLATKYNDIAGILNYAPAIKLPLSLTDITKLYAVSLFKESLPKDEMDSDERWQGYPVNPLKSVIQLVQLGNEVQRRLSRITQPVLVVQGRLDTVIHPQSGELICQRIQSEIRELHWLENSRHVILLDDELDTATDITLKFIARALHAQ